MLKALFAKRQVRKVNQVGTLEENKQRALLWANAKRAEFFMPPLTELPKGTVASRQYCVLGNATAQQYRFYASSETVHKHGSDREQLPAAVAAFEGDFERGFYPELELSISPCGRMQEYQINAPTAEDSPLALV